MKLPTCWGEYPCPDEPRVYRDKAADRNPTRFWHRSKADKAAARRCIKRDQDWLWDARDDGGQDFNGE